MKRLKLKHAYHDALIRSIRYRDNEDVAFDIDLCNCCNPSPATVTLTLLGVQNFAEMQAALEAARQRNAERGYIDGIVGIVRGNERGVLLDLMVAGVLHVDARGLHEA
jgi:hypothetical protein